MNCEGKANPEQRDKNKRTFNKNRRMVAHKKIQNNNHHNRIRENEIVTERCLNCFSRISTNRIENKNIEHENHKVFVYISGNCGSLLIDKSSNNGYSLIVNMRCSAKLLNWWNSLYEKNDERSIIVLHQVKTWHNVIMPTKWFQMNKLKRHKGFVKFLYVLYMSLVLVLVLLLKKMLLCANFAVFRHRVEMSLYFWRNFCTISGIGIVFLI